MGSDGTISQSIYQASRQVVWHLQAYLVIREKGKGRAAAGDGGKIKLFQQ